MLYSLLVAVIILSFLMPFACWFSFCKGFNLNINKNGLEGKIDTLEPLPKKKHKRTKEENKELERMNLIFSNIDAYDGTPNGQRKVD